MFSRKVTFSIALSFISIGVIGCGSHNSKNGNHKARVAVEKSKQGENIEVIDVVAKRPVRSAIVGEAVEKADALKKEFDLEGMNSEDAKIIVGSEMMKDRAGAHLTGQTVLSLPAADGSLTTVIATYSLYGGADTQDRLIDAFDIRTLDFSKKIQTTPVDLGVEIQISSYCKDNCSQVAVLMSISQKDQVLASAYYVFSKEDGLDLVLQESSLGDKHTSVKSAVEVASQMETAQRLALEEKQAIEQIKAGYAKGSPLKK